jgi:hypothetical protein
MPSLGVWKFASCDGCQLTLLDCEDELLLLAEQVQIAAFAEASSAFVGGPYDVSLVEGSITTSADERRIREIREQSGVLVAILPPFVRDLPPLPIAAFRDTPALAILMIVLVFAVVLAQALSLSGTIAGAIRLPRRAAPDVSANPAPTMAVSTPTFAPSRAETIATMAQSTPGGGVGGSSPRSGALVAANLVEAPMVRATPAADYAGRLGQVRETTPSRTSFASDLRPLIK